MSSASKVPTGEIRDGRRPSESFIPIAITRKGRRGKEVHEQIEIDFDTTGERATLVAVKAAERAGAGKVGGGAIAAAATNIDKSGVSVISEERPTSEPAAEDMPSAAPVTARHSDDLVKQFDTAMKDIYVRAKRPDVGLDKTE